MVVIFALRFFCDDDDDNNNDNDLDNNDDDDANDADKKDSEVVVHYDEGRGGGDSIAGIIEVLPDALSVAEGVPFARAMLMKQLWCCWEQFGGIGGGGVSPATCLQIAASANYRSVQWMIGFA
jgi:hypothetical protein